MQKIFFLIISLLSVHLCNAQNVGIGTTSPSEKLHVAGNIKSDTLKPNGIKLSPNAASGKILTSDAAGNASWQESKAGAASVGFGTWGDCATNAILSEYNPAADSSSELHEALGSSVSIYGNFAISGAPLDDIGTSLEQGSAAIFQFNGSNWVLMQKLVDPTGVPGANFGQSVSIYQDFAVVGSPRNAINGNPSQGSASVYRFNGSSWTLMQQLSDPAGFTNDNFAQSVSISGNFIAVGTFADDVGPNTNQGSVNIYRFNGASWILTQQLIDPDGSALDNFGMSVHLADNKLIVSATGDDVTSADQGSACIYRYNGSSWILMQKITDPAGATGDFFGNSVSISGNYAVVGAYGDAEPASDQGSASIYFYNGTSWTFTQKLSDAAGGLNEWFGNSVSIAGNHILIGAPSGDIGASGNHGLSFLYARVGSVWEKLQLITDPYAKPAAYFGTAVALDVATKRFVIGSTGLFGKVVFGKIN